MTTPDHDFLGWSTDSSLPPVWDTPAEWVQPSPPEWSVPPSEAPSPPQQALESGRPRRTWTSPPQPTHRSVGAQPASAPPASPNLASPNLAAATRSESSRGSRRPSASTARLAGAAVASVILAVFMIARVISSGGFRNGLLALVLSIVAVALVAATVLRARNVP